MADRVRAAVVQLNPGPDIAANVESAERLVERAAALGAELVVLPEKWNAYGTAELVQAAAEPLEGGSVVAAMSGWARRHGIVLVGGSITEAPERAPGKPSNTSVVFGPDGRPLGVYRKLHMFDVDVGGTRYRESDLEEPGSEAVVVDAAGWRVGLSICFDLRFPELYRTLALAGAEIVTVPSAFTLFTGKDHWEVLLRARAIENQCYVLAPDQWGTDAGGRATYGRSMIVDPWGLVIAQAGDGDDVVVADLDRDVIRRIRRDLPSLANRRPSAYRLADAA